jgi:hypothetical protein
MPITTYALRSALRRTTDPDLCAALLAVPGDICVTETPMRYAVKPAWWQFPLRSLYHLEVGYSVLRFVADTLAGPEWQVITFYREDTGTRLNTVVPKEIVLAYLYGCATHGTP